MYLLEYRRPVILLDSPVSERFYAYLARVNYNRSDDSPCKEALQALYKIGMQNITRTHTTQETV